MSAGAQGDGERRRPPRRSRRGGVREQERRQWNQPGAVPTRRQQDLTAWEQELRRREDNVSWREQGYAPQQSAWPPELPWCLVCEEVLEEDTPCRVPPPAYRNPNLEARDAGPGAPYPSGYWGRVHTCGCYAVVELERQAEAASLLGTTLRRGAVRRLAVVLESQCARRRAADSNRENERVWLHEAVRRYPELREPGTDRSRTPRRGTLR